MAKKCPECPPCAVAEYMLTYGDLMTLLLTFFVLLLSFSSISEAKFNKAVGSLKGAMSVLKVNNSWLIKSKYIPMYTNRNRHEMEFKIEKIIEQIENDSQKAGTHKKISVSENKERIHFRLSDDLLFASGSAQIKAVSDSLMSRITNILSILPYTVRVEGHTDNIPISTARYRNNWELSSSRALSIVELFTAKGINPARFEVIGYGEYKPLASNETAAGRTQNRRVEIFINLKGNVKKDYNPANNLQGN